MLSIQSITAADRPWIQQFIVDQWGADIVAGHGVIYHPAELEGFIAVQDGEKVGVITYLIENEQCEIITIDSLRSGSGIGTALIAAVKAKAIQAGCKRLWLITTNDNLNALRFYQKRGFVLVAVHRNAVAVSRQIKPSIPLIGADGIPLRNEIELVLQPQFGKKTKGG